MFFHGVLVSWSAVHDYFVSKCQIIFCMIEYPVGLSSEDYVQINIAIENNFTDEVMQVLH